MQSIDSIIIFMLKLGQLVTTSGCICKIFSASICLFWFGPLANGHIICAWLQLEMGGGLASVWTHYTYIHIKQWLSTCFCLDTLSFGCSISFSVHLFLVMFLLKLLTFSFHLL